ncbi:MAG: hypothetical protein NTY66_00800 [Candidatus Vogelbacteria bacterium]|nr:hypothetical protein [Candidatus Vogelbacteria bacterium]
MAKDILNFKPKEVVKKLLAPLSDRARDIIIKRYGLGKNPERMTLEAIGTEYKITRERVRQIENFAINSIKKSENYPKADEFFTELKALMDSDGGVVHEYDFLDSVSKEKSTQNHVHFMLVLSDVFFKLKEDDDFHHRWTVNRELADKVHNSIKNLCQNFTENDLVSEPELINRFLTELNEITTDDKTRAFAKKWLTISKSIGQNPLGEWGLVKSPNVKMRGIRDYAYLVIRQNGSPMHFVEVAKAITNTFGKKAHPATCHNELIKDKRFVLVGRGLYALAEWGYTKGIVADVIRSILAKDGPLSREEVVSKVLKERHVKENTIVVNLQNPKYFRKDKTGKYAAV